MSTWSVQLAVYDLSQGMARGLSAQFLGPAHAIDIIPHTGIVVYGREYFFGGGIQSEPPDLFRRNTGLHPIQIISLGTTTVTQVEFERWCATMMVSGQYSAAAYDLLSRNCNNFSHDAALQGLRLSTGVPQWILDVPSRFLSSPMGQLVRPMLQNMQLTSVEGAQPVGNAVSSATAPPAFNPWANISPPTETNVSRLLETPTLDAFSKPLLANDKSTVPLCIKKVRACLGESEQNALDRFYSLWTNGEPIDSHLSKDVCDSICTCFTADPSVLSFALMLFRIIILTANAEDILACLNWIRTNLGSIESPLHTSVAARALAWTCLANWMSKSSKESFVDELVDLAIADLPHASQPRPEVRQAASAFLFNTVLMRIQVGENLNSEISDAEVTLLCSALEGLTDEPDALVQLRRLMIAGRILKPRTAVQTSSVSLVQDLGLVEAIRAISLKSPESKMDEQCKALATDLIQIL
ncbi:hypothetical protein FisN_1Lh647 [Fistulifera solaris]|uniref:PPPDE domain-containing protein n=1 Tax=Fistulifera solaris TaxID=1519565 RepID=A0A1Z5K1A5_FISSO|nr:hypothetical protein FisN_1Lh647 [Fistulifera solaris]|eukprot:GAX19886.1 hypothetical protein FisN_1Lh647 [Fistulifera solaris]